MRDFDREVYNAIGAAGNRLTHDLTLLAHDIIARRPDRADLTEDNRGRLEPRAIYKVQRLQAAFGDEVVAIFASLETEAPPVV
jgi:type IV secretory pathway protease TraF